MRLKLRVITSGRERLGDRLIDGVRYSEYVRKLKMKFLLNALAKRFWANLMTNHSERHSKWEIPSSLYLTLQTPRISISCSLFLLPCHLPTSNFYLLLSFFTFHFSLFTFYFSLFIFHFSLFIFHW